MNVLTKKNLLTLLILTVTLTFAQPNTIISHTENSQLIRDLSGVKWKMKMMLPGEGEKKGLHQIAPEDIETLVWNHATVPGDVYTDLWKAGVIEDPYFGRNSTKAQWVQQYEWWYSHQFHVSESLDNKVIKIVFEGVDYACSVWLNGHYLGRHEGAFSGFSFDVTKYLRVSNKRLESANMLMVKLDAPPQVNALVAGKKTPWFGDYWRDIAPFGIHRKVKMVSTGTVRFDDVYANTKINKNKSANVSLELTVENTEPVPKNMNFVATIQGKNFSSNVKTIKFDAVINPGKHKIKQDILIKDPKLWWPWDMGKPNLYKVRVSLKEGNINHDFNETTFGIREVTSQWNPGFKKGVDVSFPRSTYINGKFHFIRSACWGGPPDIFVGRTNLSEYKKLIQLAKDANMNNIRIFGWHPPEIPEFYEYCNEMGITVWQDIIPLGTGNIPNDEKLLGEILNEGVRVIKERRNHPSLIMMEGGEEMLLRTRDAHFGRAFLERLGDSLQAYANLPYVPDSPLTCEVSREAGFKPKEAHHALRYFYSMGNNLHEDWLQTLEYPIIPEFAITSVPSVESLKKFIPEDELWTPGLSWGHHWADLVRLRMQNWDVFGDEMTGSLEEFVNASQDTQGIIFQNGIEYFRRQKPNLSGIALCHFITYWPDMKWGIVDNYQKPKRSYNFVKKAYQPLLINLAFTKRRWSKNEAFKGELWVVNDLFEDFKNCTVTIIFKDETGKKLQEETFNIDTVKANSASKFKNITANVLNKVNKRFFVNLELKNTNGVVVSKNDYFFLIGNQKEATKKFNAWGKERQKLEAEYGYPNYYRFYDDHTNETYQTKTQTPKARGF
ncbi:beta-galactosidase [Seonamhaeicola algicola]|uniref:Beta-mannosidase B n=1 Tax=Seonamhaeicola algicola TaxID=1719036 RepID=A0A5C7AGJ7_9FLAO|nr:sugar-binding domain-containing protein [Seonamhaeicola algicola]TXE07104.1 beta-galactosidase [Seonamhaeicola algicola]